MLLTNPQNYSSQMKNMFLSKNYCLSAHGNMSQSYAWQYVTELRMAICHRVTHGNMSQSYAWQYVTELRMAICHRVTHLCQNQTMIQILADPVLHHLCTLNV